MNNLNSKFSSFVVSLILGIIMIAFIFTGFQGFGNGVNGVASVDGNSISTTEYTNKLRQEVDRFSQFNQGKSLTEKQIEQFGIKDRVLEGLINQKIFVNYANKLHFGAGKDAVKAEISKIPYFKTNDKFDVNKYKLVLSANKLTPVTFEEQIIDQVKSQKLAALLEVIKPSKAEVLNELKLAHTKAKLNYALINKQEMLKNIEISSTDINNFLKDAKNKPLLDSLYKTYEAGASAKKEKVNSYEVQKFDLAKNHLQRTKISELSDFNKNLQKDISKLFESNKTNQLNKLSKNYGFEYKANADLALTDMKIGNVSLEEAKIFELFKNKTTGDVFTQETPTHLLVYKMTNYSSRNEFSETELKDETVKLGQSLTYYLNDELMKNQRNNAKITRVSNL